MNVRMQMTTLIAALGLSAAPLVAAATGSGPAESQMNKMNKTTKTMAMTAKVVEVDVATGTLTVKRFDTEIEENKPAKEYQAEKEGVRGDLLTLGIDKDTKITEAGGQLAILASIEPGDIVNIRYDVTPDGKMHATGVEKSSSKH